MEFTVERTLRRRGRRWLMGGGAVAAGALVWLVATLGGNVTAPLTVFLLSGLAFYGGWRDLRKAEQPFRLRIDGFGITLHDAELAWEQIEAVALWHVPNTGEDSEQTTPPKPRLTLWTAPGVTLPRKADRTWDGRTRYTLVDCEDLDQGVSDLTNVLAAHAGARFETAPRAVRPPIPVSVSGPELSVPGGEQVFIDGRQAGTWTLVWAAAAVVFSYSFWELVHGRVVGPEPFTAFGPLGAIGCWYLTGRSYRRWRKPLRLRIGSTGIGMREVTQDEQHFAWSEIAAVTVGRSQATTDKRPWLVVWPLPGTRPDSNPSYLVDGHKAYALVRLDRLPGGAEAVVPVVRAYAGERYAETA
ncbi:hypothetical protein ACFYXS_11495 [Streptomyces sp. NPDC002574]|uniref:hypothetical protein n=1 Tax=Streptomyces sp. NPDC002574 TaxID=3364652 RepID=UPI003677432F